MAFGTLTQLVASKVIAPLFTKAGPPVRYTASKILNTSDALAHATVANTVNRMQGFYAGDVPKIMGVGKAAVKTLSNMLIEQANPRVLKLRRDFGIGRETQQVSIKNLEKLRTDISLSDKAKAALKAKVLKNESRKMSWIRTLEGDEKAPPQYLKRLKKVNPEDRNALLNIARAEHGELVAQREALGDLSAITTKTKGRSTLGKTIMGQQTSQYLHGLMQGRPSALLENKLGNDIYHTIGKFNEKDFVAIKNFE